MAKWLFQILVVLTVAIWAAVLVVPSPKPKFIVCDVGQGDALLIMVGTYQILIDGGPNNRVLECLEDNLPFYDRRIEAVLLTHPDADHLVGLVEVFKRYSVTQFIRLPVPKDTHIFKQLMQASEGVPQIEVYAGDSLKFGATEVVLDVVWPTKEYFDNQIHGDFEVNLLSIVGVLSYGQTDILLTGDADEQVDLAQMATGLLRDIDILKVPHHGSKKALLPEWLTVIKPELALISVGRDNRYGHPGQELLDILNAQGVSIIRTDQVGAIEIELSKDDYRYTKVLY